jgi:hypothetical protein
VAQPIPLSKQKLPSAARSVKRQPFSSPHSADFIVGRITGGSSHGRSLGESVVLFDSTEFCAVNDANNLCPVLHRPLS